MIVPFNREIKKGKENNAGCGGGCHVVHHGKTCFSHNVFCWNSKILSLSYIFMSRNKNKPCLDYFVQEQDNSIS